MSVKLTAFFILMHGAFVAQGVSMQNITITSTEFLEGQSIPSKYTCDGANINPSLSWSTIPAPAKSLVLICDDPDAPKGTWIHWILFNIPAHVRSIPEDVKIAELGGALEGITSFGKAGYGGPCPPSGTHRYYFKLYALDIDVPFNHEATIDEIHAAMKGHIVAEGALMGKYKKIQSNQ